MPLLQINAPVTGAQDTPIDLGAAAAPLAAGRGPIVIMVHGYRFAPGRGEDCPHRHILSLAPSVRDPRAVSWPRGLGLAPGQPIRAIAFGWQGMGPVRRAWDNAAGAGQVLAKLVEALHSIAPHRPVQAMGHSMGARVILSALETTRGPGLARAVLMNPAAYQSQARRALAAMQGRETEVISVTSGENDLFDLLLETLVPAPCRDDRSLGAGLPGQQRFVTLRLDDPRALAALARLGHDIARPVARICHWSPYLRPGVFDLYRALLWSADRLSLDLLRHSLPQDQPPRWSRLRQGMPKLPMARRSASAPDTGGMPA